MKDGPFIRMFDAQGNPVECEVGFVEIKYGGGLEPPPKLEFQVEGTIECHFDQVAALKRYQQLWYRYARYCAYILTRRA